MSLEAENAELKRRLEIARVLLNATMRKLNSVMLTRRDIEWAMGTSLDLASECSSSFGLERFYLALDEDNSRPLSIYEVRQRMKQLSPPEPEKPKALPEPFIDGEVIS